MYHHSNPYSSRQDHSSYPNVDHNSGSKKYTRQKKPVPTWASAFNLVFLILTVITTLMMAIWLAFLLYADFWPLSQMANNDLCRWAGWSGTLWITANVLFPLIFEVAFKLMCCPGDNVDNKPRSCWKTLDIVHFFWNTVFTIGMAVLAVYGIIFLIDMDWKATGSAWFRFSMVAMDIVLWIQVLRWILLAAVCSMVTFEESKLDNHATFATAAGKRHHSRVEGKRTDVVEVEVELSEEHGSFEDYDHAQNGYHH